MTQRLAQLLRLTHLPQLAQSATEVVSPWIGVGGSAGMIGIAVLVVRILWTRTEKLEQRAVTMMQQQLDQEKDAHERTRSDLNRVREEARHLRSELDRHLNDKSQQISQQQRKADSP